MVESDGTATPGETRTSSHPGPWAPYVFLRRNPGSGMVALVHLCAMPADWLYVVALFALAFDITHSATVIGLLTLTRLLPPALFAPLFGAVSDRWSRRALLVGANMGRALGALLLLMVHDRSTLPVAFALVFVMAALSGLYRPALNASLPSLVRHRDLLDATSLMSQIDMASYGLGPGLAGLLVSVGHRDAAFLLTATLFLLSSAAVSAVPIPQHDSPPDSGQPSLFADALGGFTYLVRYNAGAPAAYVASIGGLSVLSGAYWAVAGALAVNSLHLGSEGMGYLSAAYGAGGMSAGLVVGVVAASRSVTWIFVAAIAVSCLAAGLFGLSPAGPLPFVWNVVMGAADVLSVVCVLTILQVAAPMQQLGRVFGAYESVLIASMALGSLLVGPLVAVTGPRLTTVIFAAGGLLALIGCLPWLLRLESVLGLRLFLHRVPLLAPLSGGELDALRTLLQREQFPASTTIVREGEPGDRFYLIKHGRVQIWQRDALEGHRLVRQQGAGDYFGEIALLRDVPRTATVTAATPVEAYCLHRADFQELLRRSPGVAAALEGGTRRYLSERTRTFLRR